MHDIYLSFLLKQQKEAKLINQSSKIQYLIKASLIN